MNIGENLARLRKDKQISVYKLSQLSDVSINYIRRVEKGESVPSIAMRNLKNPIFFTPHPVKRNWFVSIAS